MLEVRNRYSNELLARLPLAQADELDRVAHQAHAAFQSFQTSQKPIVVVLNSTALLVVNAT